ncbi:MAG: response regulator [Burkholderiales bacterium]
MAILPAGAPTDARERNVDDAAVTDRHHATNLNEPNRGELDSSRVSQSAAAVLDSEPNVRISTVTGADVLQRLRSAVSTLAGVAYARGLGGLCAVAEHVHDSLALMRTANDSELEAVKSVCTRLSTAARGYLAAPGDEQVSHALIGVLAAPALQRHLTGDERDQILRQLREPSMAMATAEETCETTAGESASPIDHADALDGAYGLDEPEQLDGRAEFAGADGIADLNSGAMGTDFSNEAEQASIAITEVEPLSPVAEATPAADAGAFDPASTEATLSAIEELAIERGMLGLEEAGLRARQGLHALCEDHQFGTARDLIERFASVAWAYIDAPTAQETSGAIVALLAEPGWPQPLSEDDAPLLSSLLRDDEAVGGIEPADASRAGDVAPELPIVEAGPVPLPHADAFESPHDGEDDATDVATAREAVSDPAGVSVELIEMLRAEAAKLKPGLDEMLERASASEQDAAERRGATASYAEEITRLAEACTAVGLAPLGELLGHVSEFVLRDCVEAIGEAHRNAISGLLGLVETYLATPNDPSLGEGLVDILRHDCWSTPIAADAGAMLAHRLSEVVLVSNSADTPARQTEATADDVSLAIPDDINRELFETLLQELPIQTAEFSGSVQRLAGDEGTNADVDNARRAAHTLKGAANTVGIRGIANLTHHVEDILTALFKHSAKPGPALASMLVEASDCLEAMCEFVTGAGPAPDQSRGVLQAVLDWANRIDDDGIETAGSVSASASEESKPAPAEDRPPQATDASGPNQEAAGAVARVPVTLIDELLRLTGETIISTGQVSDRVRRVIDHIRTIQSQNQTFVSLAAEMENLVDVRGIASPQRQSAGVTEFDALEFEHYGEIHTVSRRLAEAATDSREFTAQVQSDLAALDELVDGQGRLHLQSQEAVMQTRMVPASTILSRLQRTVRQATRQLSKEVALNVSGAETPIDSQILGDLVDPLMHMLRNAIDHGIEDQAERERAGKPGEGRIDLAFAREGNHVLVRIQDDGAGLDLAAIRRTAEAKGLIRADQALGDDELRRLILAPGFSTRTEATQLSGRGVGMDVVHSSVLKLKGSINLRSTRGKGLLVELRLPAALISTHALQIGLEGRILAVSTRGIDDIVYASADQVQSVGGIPSIRLADEFLAIVDFESLLELPVSPESSARTAFPVLLVRQDSGARKAIRVREVVSSRDIVVKPLSAYLPKIQGIVGLTVLGDGDVQPVIDLLDLLSAPMGNARYRVDRTDHGRVEGNDGRTAGGLSALVVDDSISARRATAQCMKDAGFLPRTAIDGQDALAVLDKWTPDIVLLDLEMPRMNGLELAVALRARPATRDTPIIMITSRSTEKHRRQAQAAGINLYLTKPFSDDDLVQQARELVGARAHA